MESMVLCNLTGQRRYIQRGTCLNLFYETMEADFPRTGSQVGWISMRAG